MKWMTRAREDKLYFGLSIAVAVLLVLDLFLLRGHSAYMDGIAHLTTLTQFYEAMKQGFVRITWTDGFANYGMPIPLYIHQTVGYLGGWLAWLLRGDVVMVYKLMFLMGAVFSSAVFYKFLRLYYTPLSSFVGVFLMNVAPYRILNLYIREALPEFLAAVMFPLILLATHHFVKAKSKWAGAILTGVFALIALSHPMMLIVGSALFAGYLLFLLQGVKNYLPTVWRYAFFMGWGLLIAAYYIIPLKVEIKYFYYGLQSNHLTPGQYLGLANYLDPNWYYFYIRDVANRGHFVKGGLLETAIMVAGTVTLAYFLWKKKVKKIELWHFAWGTGLVLIFLTTKYAGWLYENIDLLANIQFPWRMLSAYIYIPAILVAALVDSATVKKVRPYLAVLIIALVAIWRFPQMYAKNNTMHDIGRYYFTPVNLHSTLMNTVWTGETAEYPRKETKPEIIEGKGEVEIREVKYGRREYRVKADGEIRMADYTFYFPGWEVKVDGQPVTIEFQDPNYRGVITYRVPGGEHLINLRFGDTKLRQVANAITLTSLGAFLAYLGWIKTKGGRQLPAHVNLLQVKKQPVNRKIPSRK